MTTTQRSGNDQAVLSYYGREAIGDDNNSNPYAGLSLASFRAARGRLLGEGTLVRTPNGRYVPAKAVALTQVGGEYIR
jgi:hypothetical protein